MTIQLALGLLFAVAALALRGPLEDDLFSGSATLYWVMIVAVLAYAVATSPAASSPATTASATTGCSS